ncbi:MAG: Smr/MutS family protein, partial [Bacteroidaceae bacterium]|nr:Smr/MutS family protein [Bacteroidaceae bacterium]
GEGQSPLVIDLHASEILETTAGMQPIDILHYQTDYFNKIMKQNLKNVGQKIVFIHGKGEGVLRAAIINELTYRYKRCKYQDASFQEYGFGATMVTIRA